jgi:hypothetical protein
MQVTPYSEKQIAEMNLWPKGEYPFSIVAAEQKTSKKGNEMIVLSVQIFNAEGRVRTLNDYLLDMPEMAHKLRHAAVVCGLEDKYNAGTLEPFDFVDKTGVAKVGIQKSKDEQYADKNVINDYLAADASKPVPVPQQSAAAELNDEIPFAILLPLGFALLSVIQGIA